MASKVNSSKLPHLVTKLPGPKAKKIIDSANESAGKMIDEARAAAKSLQERESQRAIIEAEQIVTKARDAAAREKTKMLAELKREVARLVIDTTSKVSGKVLNAGDQKRLTEEVATELAAYAAVCNVILNLDEVVTRE